MIRTPRSFDRLGGYRTIEQGAVVIRLDIVRTPPNARQAQTIVCRLHETHARRCLEAVELRQAAEMINAPTFPSTAA